MDNIKLYTWLVFLLMMLSPFILQPWIEALEHRQLMIEKHGRLIDAKTSAPLPNATVVFNWREHHHHVGCTPQRATTTNEHGDFVLPDISSDVTFDRTWLEAVLGTITLIGYYTATYDYTITVYAPGVALVAPWQATSDPPGLTYTLTDPPGKEVGKVFELEPIKVTRTSFTPADEITYLANLEDALRCEWFGQVELPEARRARADIAQRIRVLPCLMPAALTMKAQVLQDYLWGLHDDKVYAALKPPGATGGFYFWKRDMPTGDVCRAAQG